MTSVIVLQDADHGVALKRSRYSIQQKNTAMTLDFEKYAMKGNEFLNKLAVRLGDENNRDRAGRILRSFFRTIRDHITPEESMDLLAQLPMALKGVYVDGWKLNKSHTRIRTLEEFASEMIRAEGNSAWRDFGSLEEVIQSVRAVIETLAQYISPGEMEEVANTLPGDLRKYFADWIPV
jgi:uncharacterized protein (DUF2267 family)